MFLHRLFFVKNQKGDINMKETTVCSSPEFSLTKQTFDENEIANSPTGKDTAFYLRIRDKKAYYSETLLGVVRLLKNHYASLLSINPKALYLAFDQLMEDLEEMIKRDTVTIENQVGPFHIKFSRESAKDNDVCMEVWTHTTVAKYSDDFACEKYTTSLNIADGTAVIWPQGLHCINQAIRTYVAGIGQIYICLCQMMYIQPFNFISPDVRTIPSAISNPFLTQQPEVPIPANGRPIPSVQF